MRKLRLPVPTTIITGTLGVGKTTALCKLVSKKPPLEHWCIIVNEYGAVGIDAVALQSSAAAAGDTVVVKQIAGGCMCCAQSGVLLPAIAQIIRQTKPDRLLIEPSGLGHPAGLLDILQGPHLGSSLQVNAIICLVDLCTFSPQQLASNPTAWDQVTIADVLVGNKADAAPATAAESFQQWASEELFPPKSEVLLSHEGNLDLTCLLAPRSQTAPTLLLKSQTRSSRARQQQQRRQQQLTDQTLVQPDPSQSPTAMQTPRSPQSNSAAADPLPVGVSRQPQPGKPLRVVGQQQQGAGTVINRSSGGSSSMDLMQHSSCGWVFDQSDVFDGAKLLQLLQALGPVVPRIKGVFRIGPKQWVMPAAVLPAPLHPSAGVQQPATTDGDTGSTSAVAATEAASNCSSHCSVVFQDVCYRGSSMVEVILVDGTPQRDHAAAIAATLTAAGFVAPNNRHQQQQGSACSQQQELPAELERLCLGGGSLSSPGVVNATEPLWLLIEQALLAVLKLGLAS